MKPVSFFLLCSIVMLFSCETDSKNGIQIITHTFNFNESAHEWTGGFADFPLSQDDSALYELKYCYTDLNSNTKAIMLSGNNHSDDLFMFMKKKLTGFTPNTTYTVTFEVELASDAADSSVGTGGSPGESVYLKVGATQMEPKSVIENNEHVMNIDKGVQSQSGVDMLVIGNIAAPAGATGYTIISRSNAGTNYSNPFVVGSNSRGELWLIVGTDSGFEGVTTVYYTAVSAVFSATQ